MDLCHSLLRGLSQYISNTWYMLALHRSCDNIKITNMGKSMCFTVFTKMCSPLWQETQLSKSIGSIQKRTIHFFDIEKGRIEPHLKTCFEICLDNCILIEKKLLWQRFSLPGFIYAINRFLQVFIRVLYGFYRFLQVLIRIYIRNQQVLIGFNWFL